MTPEETVERALAAAGGDAVAVLHETRTANLRWANNALTTNGVTTSRALTLVRIVAGPDGVRAGVASTSRVGVTEIADLAAAARRAADDLTAAEDAMPLLEGRPDPGWTDPPGETSIEVFGRFAPALGTAFETARAAERTLYGFAEHVVDTTYVGTSTGLRRRDERPTGRADMTGKAPGPGRSAWVGRATPDFTDVDPLELDAELDRRLRWSSRRLELPPGRHETVLPPAAVADLMIYLYWSAGARPAFEGSTVFSRKGGGTRLGEELTPAPLTLRSNPAEPGLECEPFVAATSSGPTTSVFDNGLALRPTAWIRDGRLTGLVSTRHSAELAGVPVAPAIDNLVLEGAPGEGRSLDEMVAATDRGLLVTCLWYIREVDPATLLLTGLTRDGVFVVERGEVTGSVSNYRFNESPVDLLGRVTETGRSERTLPREWGDYFTRTAMPTLRVPDFNMSTESRAS